MDNRLIELLVCPLCKGPLKARRDDAQHLVGLVCPVDRMLFPIHDGIPVMLESGALPVEDEG